MLQDEQILTFSEAAKVLPKVNGRHTHASTIWRWARKGVRGVHLEVRRFGGRFVTSVEALDRFGKALAELDADPRHRPAGQPAAHRCNCGAEQAEAELAKAGI